MGICVKFTKTTYQIWSRHVTLASNSENVCFSPNSVLNFRKSYQIWGKLAEEQKSYRQKTNWWVGNTPPQCLCGPISLGVGYRVFGPCGGGESTRISYFFALGLGRVSCRS